MTLRLFLIFLLCAASYCVGWRHGQAAERARVGHAIGAYIKAIQQNHKP
jgi:hypothetical protein